MTLREILEEKSYWEEIAAQGEVFGDNTIATIQEAIKWAIGSMEYKNLTKDAKVIALAWYNQLTPAQKAAAKASTRNF